MSVIKSLFINYVESVYDANYIMDAFYNNNIASVSRVTLLPMKTATGDDYNRAYVGIAHWHDNEMAYNFIQRLKILRLKRVLFITMTFGGTLKLTVKNTLLILKSITITHM